MIHYHFICPEQISRIILEEKVYRFEIYMMFWFL